MAALNTPVVVQRLILIVLLGAAATFGTVKFRQHHDHQVACNDAEVVWLSHEPGDGTPPPPKGC